jgi:2,3,4,5-tetrahydropyridine-2-carboxylate N-succinyltransferase
MDSLYLKINQAWNDTSLLADQDFLEAVLETIALLDQGKIRVAEPDGSGWKVNEWIKKAILLFFRVSKLETIESGAFEFFDKIPLKKNFASLQIRVVPQALARYGSFIEPGAILMPSYVNIGAYVGSGTMVDTWATVGSCAQIGKQVHLSGGVGIGGVLEPPQAAPVIIEDHAFIGSRCIIVEGVKVWSRSCAGSQCSVDPIDPYHRCDPEGAPDLQG